MEKYIIDYTEYEKYICKLVDFIKIYNVDVPFSAVHGFPRGGLPIAVHISHHLEIPMIYNIPQFYNKYPNGHLLVVDDIIDTGKTYELFLDYINKQNNINYTFAVLFYKTRSKYIPDIYVKKVSAWVVFPWEKFDELPSDYHQRIYSEFFSSNGSEEIEKLIEDVNS